MRSLLPIFGIFSVISICLGGRLEIVLPDDRVIEAENNAFNAYSLHKFNKQVFGLEAGADAVPTVSNGKLFEKPKALLVIDIVGLYNHTLAGQTFKFTNHFDASPIGKDLEAHFGEEMLHVESSAAGIKGITKRDDIKQSEDVVAFDGRQDIANMHELAKIIKSKDRTKANVVDFYRIQLDVSNARTEMEKRQLAADIQAGVEELRDAIKTSTGTKPVQEFHFHSPPMSGEEKINKMKAIWKRMLVHRPRSQDCPAAFAIIVLAVFFFVFAATSMLWFMWDEEDMGKNSLVYRLSGGRPKKD